MYRTDKAALDRGQHPCHIASEQGRDIQPQPGKCLTAQETLWIQRQAFILSMTQHKPIHGPIEHPPYHIFSHPTPPIHVQLRGEVKADTARRYLDYQLRCRLNIIVSANTCLTTAGGGD
jgi:hypothetical protein